MFKDKKRFEKDAVGSNQVHVTYFTGLGNDKHRFCVTPDLNSSLDI